jgi:imidazolonepropionase-like amidohydrolase
MRTTVCLLSLTLAAAALSPAALSAEVIAFRGATVYPIVGAPIPKGTVVVEDGKIRSIGVAEAVTVPPGAKVVDLAGKVLLPGLVDTHSHLGGGDGADSSAPLQPDDRIMDAIDPRSDTFMKARSGGITTVNVMPGSGHLMSGQTVYLKMRRNPRTIDDLLFCRNPLTEICGGMKMANGTNSIKDAPFPGTRSKAAALVRSMFVKARQYRDKTQKAKGDPKKLPDRDLQMEALVEILEGRRQVHFHTHKAEDALTAIRLGKEFGFRPVLHHVSEAWKIPGELAAAGVPCSIITLDSPGGKLETVELRMENGAALEKAGVAVAYHTDDPITDSRLFLRSAAMGVRAGMSKQKALEALTLTGAKMLGLEKRVGSLEVGKDADLVVLSGDPFSVYTHVEQTWVEGKKVFDRADPADRKFATGGYEVYRGELFEEDLK